MRSSYVTGAAERGVDPFAVEVLAQVLHNQAVGCEAHGQHRVANADLVHQHDAFRILLALRRRMDSDGVPRIDGTRAD